MQPYTPRATIEDRKRRVHNSILFSMRSDDESQSVQNTAVGSMVFEGMLGGKRMRRDTETHFTLSRRNILNLLHMLDNRDKQHPALIGDGFVIGAEEDDEHYRDRYAAGVMSWEATNE